MIIAIIVIAAILCSYRAYKVGYHQGSVQAWFTINQIMHDLRMNRFKETCGITIIDGSKLAQMGEEDK